MGDDKRAQVDKVLANLARQTNLTFRREKRKVNVWFVAPLSPGPQL